MATKAQRLAKIDELINNDLVSEDHRDWLDTLTDNQLASLADPEGLDELVTVAANAMEDGDEEKDDDTPTDNEDTSLENVSDEDLEAEMAKRKKGKKPTADKPFGGKKAKPFGNQPTENAHQGSLEQSEWFLSAPPEAQRLLLNAKAAEDAERTELIELITANEANDFSEDTLKATKVETLRGLARLAATGLPQRHAPANDYSGRMTGNSLVGNGHEEAPMGLPDLDWNSSSS